MSGTGRPRWIEPDSDTPTSTRHDGPRLHKGYADWILAPEYSERSGGPRQRVQPVVRGRNRAASKPTTRPTSPATASASGATGIGSDEGGPSARMGRVVASLAAAGSPAAPSPDPTTIAPIMPGWSGHMYGYVPASSNVTLWSSPGSSSAVPHVCARPMTWCWIVAVFRNRMVVPSGTRATVGAKLQMSIR